MIKDFAQISDKGLVRENNQDSIYANANESVGLFVVADGMGGHECGEKASATICEGLRKWWETTDRDNIHSAADMVQELTMTIKEISDNLYGKFRDENIQGGTTVCALMILPTSFAVVTVGDSRVYSYEKKLRQLSQDDVWENLSTTKKQYTSDEIMSDPRNGKLTQAAGFDPEVTPRIVRGILKKDMTFIICSDGVYKYCYEQELQNACKQPLIGSKTSQKIVDEICKNVLEHGAGDNYSTIVCRIK